MKFADRACDTTTTTGTGDISLSGAAPTGYQSLAAIPVGDDFEYCIKSRSGNEWEIGTGRRTGPTTLQRVTVLSGSNGTSKVSFSAGTKDVFCVVSAARLAKLLASDAADTQTIPADFTTVFVPVRVGSGYQHIALEDLLSQAGTAALGLPTGSPSAGDYIVVSKADGSGDYRVLVSSLGGGASAPVDTVAPTVTAASVANGTPTVVNLTASESLDPAYVPAASAFTVGGHVVSSVAISGSAINLTVTAAFVNGEAARTVGYTPPGGAGNARDVAGNLLAAFSGLAVTNNVAPASSTVSGVTVSPAAPTVAGGATQQFAADVAGTNSPSQGVTWGASAGTISSAGLFTAPAATSSAQSITITATSTQDPTKSGTTTVTVPATAQAAYTIVGNTYSGSPNKPYATLSAANVDADYGTMKRWGATKQSPGIYYTITPTPASAIAGWSNSNSVPPAAAVVDSSGSSVNGHKAMSHPSSWGNTTNLYGAVGERWYFWIKPVDGAWFCVDTAGTLIVA